MATKKEALEIIKDADEVYVGTCLTPNDVIYIKISKASIKEIIRLMGEGEYNVRHGGRNAAYIN
jgi:hypothetical protein